MTNHLHIGTKNKQQQSSCEPNPIKNARQESTSKKSSAVASFLKHSSNSVVNDFVLLSQLERCGTVWCLK